MNFKFPDSSPLTTSLQDLVLNSPANWRRTDRQNDGDSGSKDSGFESPLPRVEGADPLFLAPQQPPSGERAPRRCLFGGDATQTPPSKTKRSRNDDDGSASKRQRHRQMFLSPQLGKENRSYNPFTERVKKAVEKLEDGQNLIGDGSQSHVLPTLPNSKHDDLKCIAPATMCKLIDGGFSDIISSYRVIDCRYPYEFEGGHIKGAENIYTEAEIEQLVRDYRHPGTGRHILVFHCEFSSNRGPKMLRHLRGLDRKANSDCYPFLYYPEVYLLSGGYKAFYASATEVHCEPHGYTPMHHEDHQADLRHFRVKSKSWTAGDDRGRRVRRSLLGQSPAFM